MKIIGLINGDIGTAKIATMLQKKCEPRKGE